jgi:hypothetical protein
MDGNISKEGAPQRSSEYGEVVVTPVGSQRNSITHFAIEIQNVAPSSSLGIEDSINIRHINSVSQSNSGFAMNVMG